MLTGKSTFASLTCASVDLGYSFFGRKAIPFTKV
jgi:hypothetical protein